MTRRQEIENIIIGTLLSTFDTDWFADCCYCITTDMFKDVRNAKIYSAVCEYRNFRITAYDLCIFDNSLFPLASYMVNLAINFDFFIKKVNYNRKVWRSRQSTGKLYKYTDVKFSDYVWKFLEMVIIERKSKIKLSNALKQV